MDTTATTHKISWFVVLDGQLFPRTSTMRGEWAYELKCSCGWATHTGGAVKSYITNEARFHKAHPELS